jgi:hypothetical protein
LLSAQAQNFPENLLHKEEAQQVPEASGWACKFNYLEYAPLLIQRVETLNPKSLLLVCSNVVVTGAQLPFMIRGTSHKAYQSSRWQILRSDNSNSRMSLVFCWSLCT